MKNGRFFKKSIKWVLAVVAVGAVAASYLYEYTKPIEVEGYKVSKIDIRDSFTEDGAVKAKYESDVYAYSSGDIEKLAVEEGQNVNKGDLILSIDTSELRHSISQLEGQLRSISGQQNAQIRSGREEAIEIQRLSVENAQKEYDDAVKEYERGKLVYEQDAMSNEDIEGLRKEMEIADNILKQQVQSLSAIEKGYDDPNAMKLYFQGQKDAVSSQIELLNYRVQKSSVYAPQSGFLKSLDIDENDYVTTGEKIATIMKMDGIEIESRVLAQDAVDLKEGMSVEVALEHDPNDYVFSGTIRRIDPYADESVSAIGLVEKRVGVKIDISGDSRILKPGYDVDVEFVKKSQSDAIAVPKRAIFKYEGNDSIWKVVSGRAVIQKLEIGYETQDYSVIAKGLVEGDVVILNHKTEGLEPNKAVKPVY